MATRIQFRRDTAANWTSANPVLGAGEPGYETDTGKEKRGDGSTAWTSLAYLPTTSGGASISDGTVSTSSTWSSSKISKNYSPVFKPENYADLSNVSTNAGAAIQAAINAAAAAGGGVVKLESRIYDCTGVTLVIPAANYYILGSASGGAQVDIAGAGRHNTRLQWNADLGAGKYAISCGDPTATNANGLGRYSSGTAGTFVGNFTDFAVEGPGSSTITSTTLGAISTQMSGIAWGARRHMENVYIRGFYAGLDIVGDNASFENVDCGDCYYGAYWNQQSTYYYGDLVFKKCLFGHGTMAAVGLHPLSQGIKGTLFDGCYFSGSPYGIFLESDSVTTFPYLTGDVIFDNCMFEGIGNAMFYDDNATTGSAGGGVAKGILGGMIWRNSLFGWQANQLLTAGGRDRKAMIIVGQMATCRFEGIRNAQQWIPGSLALWDGGQYKGVKISGNMDPIFTAVASSGKPFIKTPGGGGFSANTIEFENIGYYKGTFLPQINGGSAVAVGNLVERSGNRFDRADATTTGALLGVALTAAAGGTAQAMTAVATSGEQIPVTLSASGLPTGWLKKGTAGLADAATGPSDGQIVGWLKLSSGTTGTVALASSSAAASATASTRTINVISALSNPDSSTILKQSEFLFRMSDVCTFKPNRWRLRVANYNVFGGAAVPTGATFTSTYAGPQAIGTDGAPTAAFSAAPTLALPGFTLPADGSEYVSGWVSTTSALPDAKVPWLFSFAYTGGDTTTGQASGTGEAWTANTAGISANVGDQVARGNKGNTTPFDLRIEYEYTVPATTTYEMGIGDSLMGGAGPTFPKYKNWPQQGANRRNRLISNVAVGSTTLAQWSDNTRRLWTRFSTASAPDRVIIGLGTNDLNSTSLASMQAYFITILGLVRSAYPGADVVAMPMPPRSLPHTRLAQYASAGSTSLIVNDSVTTGSFNLGEELFGETVTVSAVTGTGPYTLTVGATTKNHTVGEYVLGTKELQRTQYNTWLRTLPGKIQGVLSHDQVLAAPWDQAIIHPQFVHSDNVHWSVAGLARAADLAG